jgi:hypothetical protein
LDESFGSNVHDWNFNSSFRFNFNGFNSVDVIGSDIESLEKTSDFTIKIEPVIGVFSSNLADLSLPDGSSGSEVSSQGFEVLSESVVVSLELDSEVEFGTSLLFKNSKKEFTKEAGNAIKPKLTILINNILLF